MKKINLDIEGMHCGSCALLIEHTLKDIKWIQQVNVNFSAEKATITFDEEKIQLTEIQETIKHLGYKVVLADENKFITGKTNSLLLWYSAFQWSYLWSMTLCMDYPIANFWCQCQQWLLWYSRFLYNLL